MDFCVVFCGFVEGNLECKFYTLIRRDKERLRKIQLYIGPLAGIEPAALRFDTFMERTVKGQMLL